jgi:peptidoglycan/LPS O-acetylase OafA/YrhL
MAGITKQTVFMLAIYVVLIIIMYSLVGINIQSGSDDKKIPWILYGFSFIGAMGCFFALKKFDGGVKHKIRIIAYSIFLFALVTAAFVLSKPTETENFKIFTYVSIALVFIINLIAGFYLIQSTLNVIPKIKIKQRPIIPPNQLSTVSPPPTDASAA